LNDLGESRSPGRPSSEEVAAGLSLGRANIVVEHGSETPTSTAAAEDLVDQLARNDSIVAVVRTITHTSRERMVILLQATDLAAVEAAPESAGVSPDTVWACEAVAPSPVIASAI